MDRRGALKDTIGACFALLSAAAAVTAVTPGGVHQSAAPAGTVLDYAVLQAPGSGAWDSMQNPGEDVTFQVAGVTLKVDAGAALAIAQAAQATLDGARPTVNANHLCIQCRWVETRVFADPDLVNGKTAWRAVAMFKLLVDQVS